MKDERRAKLDWIANLVTEDGDGCRDWPWGRHIKGYGQIMWDGKNRRVGHIVLEMVGRPRPSMGHHQLHSCDRPSCVAPWHLRWGTNAENRSESVARGGHAHKLTDEQVLEILAAPGKQRDIAAAYGVTQRVVWGIKAGRTWRHVTGVDAA